MQGDSGFGKIYCGKYISHASEIPREGVKEQLDHYLVGANHILALRGDRPAGAGGTRGDFHYAPGDLAGLGISKEFGDKFTIAGWQEIPETYSSVRLRKKICTSGRSKQDAGADYMMTSCLGRESARGWRDKIQKARTSSD